MKLFLDESLSHRLVLLLKDAGHDAVHLSEVGLLGASDDLVLHKAADLERVLISADSDFGDLLYRAGASSPSVVLLRRAPHTLAAISRLLVHALAAVEEPLLGGAIAVVTPERVRYRLLPIDDDREAR